MHQVTHETFAILSERPGVEGARDRKVGYRCWWHAKAEGRSPGRTNPQERRSLPASSADCECCWLDPPPCIPSRIPPAPDHGVGPFRGGSPDHIETEPDQQQRVGPWH